MLIRPAPLLLFFVIRRTSAFVNHRITQSNGHADAVLPKLPPLQAKTVDTAVAQIEHFPPTLGVQFIGRLKELVEYQLEFGDCNVPRRYGPLGTFVNKQRQLYRKVQAGEATSLTPERIKALEDVGIVWSVDAKAATKQRNWMLWLSRYEELKKYQAEYGTCRISKDYEDARLRSWVTKQRQEYRKFQDGEKSAMDDEKIKLLDAIGFETSLAHEELWRKRIEELKEYIKEHGDTLVPITYAANPKLAQWVSLQRKNYNLWISGKRRPYGFTKARIDELNDLGFVWDYREHKDIGDEKWNI